MSDTSAESTHQTFVHAVVTRADGTVHDLGVIAAGGDDPEHLHWWEHFGRHEAHGRIVAANEHWWEHFGRHEAQAHMDAAAEHLEAGDHDAAHEAVQSAAAVLQTRKDSVAFQERGAQ